MEPVSKLAMRGIILAILTLAWCSPSTAALLFPDPHFDVSGYVLATTSADFDGDGHLDLAVLHVCIDNSCDGLTLDIDIGRGDGTFALRSTFTVGSASAKPQVWAGDLNGDGRPDLVVVAGPTGRVGSWLGNGDGTFSLAWSLNNHDALSVAVADFNLDGVPDLAIGTSTTQCTGFPDYTCDAKGAITVYVGQGNGTFAPGQTLQVSPKEPALLAAADLNRDGKPDLVAHDRCGSESNTTCSFSDVLVFKGNGDGSFSSPSVVTGGKGLVSAAIADFDADGLLDLAVADAFNGLSIFIGRGDGSFRCCGSSIRAGGTVGWVAAGDLDGDGKVDLVDSESSGEFQVVLNLYRGNGDGTFRDPVPRNPDFDTLIPTLGDFDGDGSLDVVVGLSNLLPGRVVMYLGHPGGLPGTAAALAFARYLTVIVPADINADGHPDLVALRDVSFYSPQFQPYSLIFDGAGGWDVRPEALSQERVSTIAAGRFNRDGYADLALATNTPFQFPPQTDAVRIGLGHGDGGTFPQESLVAGKLPSAMVVVDLNSDGLDDLVVANGGDLQNTGSDDVSVFISNGDGTFGPQARFDVGIRPLAIASGDFNHDGRPDLVTANAKSNDVSILLGAPGNQFLPQRRYQVGTTPRNVAVADFNLDGRLDLAVGNQDSRDVSILLGRGDGSFELGTSVQVGSAAEQIAAGDLDADGIPDLVTAGGDVYLGRGDGTFRFGGGYGPGGTVVLADFDGDGRLDLAEKLVSSVTVLFNRGPDPDTDKDGIPDRLDPCTDRDGDGFGDPGFPANTCPVDNCPSVSNPDQADRDGDRIGDLCDGCPNAFNPDQRDADGDGIQDACDSCTDSDGDGFGDPGFPASTCAVDNCPLVRNPSQTDTDQDGVGDLCDDCPAVPDSSQADLDRDGIGDACDACVDPDHDGFGNPGAAAATCPVDNCPSVFNPDKSDGDGDGVGDLCDDCASAADSSQPDTDGDGIGDACDPCPLDPFDDADRDGVCADRDNCPWVANPDQRDENGDGIGDACALVSEGSLFLGRITTFGSSGSPFQSLETGDITGDGVDDLIVVSALGVNDLRGGVSILPGAGTDTLRDEVPLKNTGTYFGTVALGDLNGDGRPDLIIADSTFSPQDFSSFFVSNRLRVWLGGPDGRFTSERSLLVDGPPRAESIGYGPRMQSVALGDLNGDHIPDVVITGYFHGSPGLAVTVLIGDGRGSFMPTRSYQPIGSSFDVTSMFRRVPQIADLDGDGVQDVIVQTTPVAIGGLLKDLTFLKGLGNGTLAKGRRILDGGQFALGDFNRDGAVDLAILRTEGVAIALNSGDAEFNESQSIPLAGSVSPLATLPQILARDFDGNGTLDLIVISNGEINILNGRGDGSFAGPKILSAYAHVFGLGLGQFDADRGADVVALTSVGDPGTAVRIFPNRSGQLLARGEIVQQVPAWAIAVDDLNGDGNPDIAVAGFSTRYYPQTESRVSIWLGTGDGQFLASGALDGIYLPLSVASGDLNQDGRTDLVIGGAAGDLTVVLGRGDGSFDPQPSTVGSGAYPLRIRIADLNGDGIPDVAYASSNFGRGGGIGIMLGQGDGSFGPAAIYRADLDITDLFLYDINGDGSLDVAAANPFGQGQVGSVLLLLGQGDGTFIEQPPIEAPGGLPPVSVIGADFNADGKVDLAVGTSRYRGGTIAILFGDGSGGFALDSSYPLRASTAGSLVVGDFDQDGHPDLAAVDGPAAVFVSGGQSGLISILLGHQDGTFGSPMLFGANLGVSDLAATDINHDGKLDLLVSARGGSDGSISILLNQHHVDAPPHAVVVPMAAVECTGPAGASVTLDGSGSSDPDSTPGTNDDIKTFRWFENLGSPSQSLLGDGQRLTVTLSLGAHVLTLQVIDSQGLSDSAQSIITVVDTTPPVLTCPNLGPVECSAAGGSQVSLVAAATDACSPTVIVTNSRTAGGGNASGFYPLGTTNVSFTATDPSGKTATCSTSIQVRDTAPPSLTLAVSPAILWPPNHRLVPVQAVLQVRDVCDPTSGVVLTSATSSEPDDAAGSDLTTDDIQDDSIGTFDTTVLLRAERSGDGPGRTYTLTYTARDASGNASSALGVVTVPHDQGMGPEPLLMSVEPDRTPGMAHVYWNAVPGAMLYDLIEGDLSQVSAQGGVLRLGAVRVLASGITGTSYAEGMTGRVPPVGKAFFYLAQYREAQSASGWGTESGPWPAEPTACDSGCPGGASGLLGSQLTKKK